MITTVINNHVSMYKYFSIFAEAGQPAVRPVEVPSESPVWEIINENELAAEMTNALPTAFSNSPAPEIDPDDFERLYRWFLS